MRKAQQYQHQGKRWVVDLDLEKFFDVVNHDILISAFNGRGAWYNSGANFMNATVRKKFFDQKGLVNLQSEAKYIEQLVLL